MVAAAAAASTVFALADELAEEHRAPAAPPSRADAWDARLQRPLLVASLLFVVVLTVPVLLPDLPGPVDALLRAANVGIWVFFTVEYAGRLWLSEQRWLFVRTHPLDLLIVLVPFFRPLRLVRLVAVAGRLGHQSRGGLVGDVTKMVTLAAFFTAFLGAVLALDAERGAPDTVILGFRDALWFSVGTMTAVPYGDVYPVTQEGRVIASVLMVLGLVFVGLITAAIAAWFVQFISGEEEDSAELRAVHERLVAMEQLLGQLAAASVPAQRTAAPRARRAPKDPGER